MTLWYTLGVEAYVTTNPGLKSCTVLALFIFKDEFIPLWGAIGVPNFESQERTSRYYTPITGTLFRAIRRHFFGCHILFGRSRNSSKFQTAWEFPRTHSRHFQAMEPRSGTKPPSCHAVGEGAPEASEEQDWWLRFTQDGPNTAGKGHQICHHWSVHVLSLLCCRFLLLKISESLLKWCHRSYHVEICRVWSSFSWITPYHRTQGKNCLQKIPWTVRIWVLVLVLNIAYARVLALARFQFGVHWA
jgi:hypothetical protein